MEKINEFRKMEDKEMTRSSNRKQKTVSVDKDLLEAFSDEFKEDYPDFSSFNNRIGKIGLKALRIEKIEKLKMKKELLELKQT